MNSKIQKIIILSVTAVLFFVFAITGLIVQANFKDINSSFVYNDFLETVDADGNSVVYIPYGVTVPDNITNAITVETSNASVIIETSKRVKVQDSNVAANIYFFNGKETDYASGLYQGTCEIKEFDELKISASKKSYSITLPDFSSVLGMKEEKTWLLISLDNDASMLRTYAGLQMSSLLNSQYTPALEFVEVFANGVYDGTYMLCEKVKMSVNRLVIDKAKGDNFTGEGLTGSYLMMTDMSVKAKAELTEAILDKNFYFTMPRANILPGATEMSRITFKQTKALTNKHLEYIKQYMLDAENALFSDDFLSADNGYNYYFESSNIINWYITEEVFKNPNSPTCTSTYMYKEKGGRISLGPVWYFGFSSGNSEYSKAVTTDGWYVRENAWIARMFEDPTFSTMFDLRCNVLEDVKDDMFAAIDKRAGSLVKSAEFRGMSEEDYEKEVENLKTWLTDRISWILEQKEEA